MSCQWGEMTKLFIQVTSIINREMIDDSTSPVRKWIMSIINTTWRFTLQQSRYFSGTEDQNLNLELVPHRHDVTVKTLSIGWVVPFLAPQCQLLRLQLIEMISKFNIFKLEDKFTKLVSLLITKRFRYLGSIKIAFRWWRHVPSL